MNSTGYSITLLAAMIGAALAPAQAGVPDPGPARDHTTPQSAPAVDRDSARQAEAQDEQTPDDQQDTSDTQDATRLQGVTVTPLRSSLESAQSLKRDSRMVVDSVVAEDIGKLPDNSVADAMQRITGVQVSQGFQGETTGVVVRGLPNVVTTLNGREIFSGVGRSFAFQNLPATSVKSIKVYKSSNASLLDGGIAGVVDMQLYRPLDFDGSKVAFTYTATHSKYGGHTDPNASLLLSNRWDTDHGQFGALVNASFIGQHYQYNAVWGDFPTVLTDGAGTPMRTDNGDLIASPHGFGADYNIGHRKRPELNYALQWKPNDDLEFYAEGVYAWIKDDYSQPFYFSNPVGLVTPTNLSVSDHCYANQLTGSPYEGQTICDAAGGTWRGQTYAATSTQAHVQRGHDIQNSIGVKWHGDNVSLSSDLSFTSTSFNDNTFIVDTFMKGPVTTIWDGIGGHQQNWTLGNDIQSNPDNFYLNGLFQTWHDDKAKQFAWRGDGNVDIGGAFVSYVDFGLRYAQHKATYVGSVEESIAPPGGAGTGNITETPNPANQVGARFPSGFLCAMPKTDAIPNSWLTPCFDYLTGHADEIRNLYGTPSGRVAENPGRYYHIQEKSAEAYVQMGYDAELFGRPVDGLIGMRAKRIKRNLDAYSYNADTDVYSPLAVSTSEPVYLPNISMNWHFTDQLMLRLDAAKTVSYPGFGSLNPSMSLNPGTINRAGVASSGNPNLKPIKSYNYDASLEWYFAPSGYLSGGAFYRDIDGYIQNYVTDVVINGEDYQLSSPQSAGSGHLDGAELAYQQFFDFLPGAWSGLGVQLNYTYIEGNTRSPQYLGGPMVRSPLQNVSKNNYNVVLMYEKYGVSARLAYNYRSRYIDGFNQPTVAGVNDEIEPANQLDLSIGYDVTPQLTVVLSGSNLTGANLHQYWGSGTTRPRDIRYQDRTYALGVRFKM